MAHKLVKFESMVMHGCDNSEISPDSQIELLDKLINEASERLVAMGIHNWGSATKGQAELALRTIDETLSDQGYAVCVKTNSLWQTFSTPIFLENEESRSAILDGKTCYLDNSTEYRRTNIRKYWREGLNPIDCDTGSFLYLSIANRLGIPLTIVEVPDHNFVRWKFSSGSYLNWDTNEAFPFYDSRYDYLSIDEEKNLNRYLEDLTPQEMTRYYYALLGSKIEDDVCYLNMFEEISDPGWQNALASNNFSWAISTRRVFEKTKHKRQSVKLALEATTMDPDCIYYDTLSCAYAANGEFDKAVEVERTHVSPDSKRIPYFEDARNCYEKEVADSASCP